MTKKQEAKATQRGKTKQKSEMPTPGQFVDDLLLEAPSKISNGEMMVTISIHRSAISSMDLADPQRRRCTAHLGEQENQQCYVD